MSSSGKGQSLVKSADELEHAWEYGCNGSRGDIKELIIEEFIKFDSEITLLTVTQKNGPTLFCPPIGHVQKGGDYRESFQPAHIDPAHLKEAQDMAEKVTRALTGAGLWGVEFFLSHENGVYFSELSPRPHDTGMVTLAGTQNLNEFELHCRAVLGLPIPGIKQERIGASALSCRPLPVRSVLTIAVWKRWPKKKILTCASSANRLPVSIAVWALYYAMRRWAATLIAAR